MASYVGRFAPTPSGPLHFGSLLTALGSFLAARSVGGRWLLRLDDLDGPRIQAGAAAQICDQLRAYGLQWDGEIWQQSRHQQNYAQALGRLRQAGWIYACRCTRGELLRDAQDGEETIYPGRCRALNLSEDGAALRLKVAREAEDEIGDFIVRRKDGQHAYQLACAVDEHAMGITHVVRGSDLLPSTQRQKRVLQALGLPTPDYQHLPLVVDAHGNKLSKQNYAAPLDGRQVIEDLCCALHLLGQALPSEAERRSPRSLLAAAAATWSASAVPAGPVKLA